jgi:hypothetical protein
VKIVFLDIDGVLNHTACKVKAPSGFCFVDDKCIVRLKRIIEKTDAKVVLASTWRRGYFDLLEGKYLGYNKDFVYGFGPTTQSIWVALSYKPEALKAEVTKKGYHVKVTLSLVAKTNNFTRHIINVVVKDKKGNINKSYSKKLIMDKGKHTFEFNLPLNYPIDNWVIEAQDVFSSCKVIKAL